MPARQIREPGKAFIPACHGEANSAGTDWIRVLEENLRTLRFLNGCLAPTGTGGNSISIIRTVRS